jgi:Cof subfamily protein (haloacid dehalogenase superfamily)
VRMVASDLDGTLVRDDYSMSPRTLAALEACQDAGVQVVFVTGRPPRWMPVIAQLTGHVGLAVCANGALVYDMAAGTVVEALPIAHADVLTMAQLLRDHFPGCSFAVELADSYAREPGFARHRDDSGRCPRVGPVENLLDDDAVVAKLLCRLPSAAGARADAMLTIARDLLKGLGEPVHSNPHDAMLEIGPFGVSKASTLALLAAERGLTAADVVAFGDMPNDIPMLRWAGRGYAMADGHPDAITAADAVAPPCAEDGVAQVLEALLADLTPHPR